MSSHGLKKRDLSIILLFVLTVVLLGCKETQIEGQKSVAQSGGPKSIRILLHQGYDIDREMGSGIGAMRHVAKMYREKTGVEVVFETSGSEGLEGYSNKLMAKISADGGPELLVLASREESLSVDNLIDSGIIEDVSSELRNYKELIKGVQNGYFYPCMMLNLGTTIDGDYIDDSGFDQQMITSMKDYKKAYLSWVKEKIPFLNAVHFYQLNACLRWEISGYTTMDEGFNITDDYVVDKIIEYSHYFSDAAYFKTNKSYDYDGVVSLLLDRKSKDHDMSLRMYFQSKDEQFLVMGMYNTYNLGDVEAVIEEGDIPCLLPSNEFRALGLAVNRHAEYRDDAVDFIDFMISEEVQGFIVDKMAGGKRNASGTVNKQVYEKGLEKDRQNYSEALINYKALFYEQINNNERPLMVDHRDLNRQLMLDLSDLVLAYGYGELEDEEALRARLHEINNEMFIMINE